MRRKSKKHFIALQASHASLGNQWGIFCSESDDTEYGKVRTNRMENNIQHACEYCLDRCAIILEVLLEV